VRTDGPVHGVGIVRNGRLQIVRSNVFSAQLSMLRDGPVDISVGRQKATRSQVQNSWYWSCLVGMVADHTGYSPQEIHEIYKGKFLPKTLALQDGNGEIKGEFVIGGTTTKLTPEEFAEYCDRIRQWAAETLDVNIPDPR
jgi:hypothetical protein